MNLGIEGKQALVVGATGETGRAISLALHEAGCRLTLMARGAERLYEVGSRTNAMCIPVDLMARPFRSVYDGRPDIVVHVIGGSSGIKDPLSSAHGYAEVWRLNLGIALDINNEVIPTMISRGWGRIVHLSSNAVKLAIGHSPYASAKSAVEGYVRTTGKTFATEGIVISAVRPGPIYTKGRFLYSQEKEWEKDFHSRYVPMRRWGRGEELAAMVAFMCSEHSSYMAGAVIDVDGGMR